MYKKPKNNQSIIVILIGVMILFACVSGNSVTQTVVTPTNTPCPDVPYTPSISSIQKPTFYFILIDGTLNYTNQHIDDSRKVLELALSSLLKTGDRVVIGWINDDTQYYGIESTIFHNEVFAIDTSIVSLTPTLPPTLGPFNTPTVTPTSAGQLRQTEVAKTVDSAQQQEQEAVQKAINNYLCQRGKSVAEIEEINNLIEGLRTESANSFVKKLSSKFPATGEFEASKNNPLFEVVSETTDFIKAECDLLIYENCVLVVFSDLEDFRENYSSDKVPYSNMAGIVDVLPVIYKCQFSTACDKKLGKWNEHFLFFEAWNFVPILNRDAGKDFYRETIANDLINQVHALKNH